MKVWISLLVLAVCGAGCDRSPAPPSTPPSSIAPAPPVAPPAKPAELQAKPPAPALPAGIEEQLQQAQALKAAGKLADARALLQPLAEGPDAADKTLDLLGEIDTQILLTPVPAPEKIDYTVVSGDSLAKLAKQFGTTIELIKKSNGLTRDMIRIGDRLRIYQGKFAVSVSKTANTLTLTDNGKFFKRYRVGTGEHSKTPVGEFKVTSRIEHPPWWRPDGKTVPFGDPENILGTHWLGLDVAGYGLHGTWDTNSIGKAASAGCVRLLNDHVAELYTILPVGTPVTIRD
jgi:lipoprotein-anchoring transpeptidase ErfK/SrfK